MSGLIASLKQRFVPSFMIRMTRESFTITRGETSLSLPTYLYVDPQPDGPKVISVGQEPVGSGNQLRVDLFRGSLPGIERSWALEAFLTYAIAKMTPRHALIRPSVTVTGLGVFGDPPTEDDARMLVQALMKAGAAHVEIPEWKGGD